MPTQLILRDVALSVTEQIQNINCDDKPLRKIHSGTWSVPRDCQKIQWQVPLLENDSNLASAQQSIKFNDFILFSQASSLPRLKDVSSIENLKISISNIKTIFPKTNSAGEIALPNQSEASMFVALNPIVAGVETLDSIKLTYLLDNPKAISKLPEIKAHIKGLQWLNSILPGKAKEDFTVAWLGISAKKVSLAGAASKKILLANYPMDGEFPFGKCLQLYIGLHEAFHQFEMNYAQPPAWIGESLASYYGIRASQVALPDDPNTTALKEHFLSTADHFKDGLLVINQK